MKQHLLDMYYVCGVHTHTHVPTHCEKMCITLEHVFNINLAKYGNVVLDVNTYIARNVGWLTGM